jgi:hypothetical protein
MNLRFQACVVSSLVVAAVSTVLPSRAQGPTSHPAWLVARRATVPHIDVNSFIVQPPATTAWTLGPQQGEAPLRVALKTAPRL